MMKFFDIEKLRLEGFSYQNVVSSLTFESVLEKTEYSSTEVPRVHVDLDTLFGVWATFSCSGLEVESMNTSALSIGNPAYLATKQ